MWISHSSIIRSLYFCGAFFGLNPFNYNGISQRASLSVLSLIYSCGYCFLISEMLSLYHMFYINLIIDGRENETYKTVTYAEFLCSIFRTMALAIIQILTRNGSINIINEVNDMKKSLHQRLTCTIMNGFLDKKRQHLLNIKLLSILVQIFVIILNTYVREIDPIDVFGLTVSQINSNCLPIVLNSNYFCIMLIILQFYSDLNMNIRGIFERIDQIALGESKIMKMQKFCDISDEIDEMSILYDEITNFCEKANRFFGPQLLLIITSSFLCILMDVGSNIIVILLFY